jgi:hypothetical protein
MENDVAEAHEISWLCVLGLQMQDNKNLWEIVENAWLENLNGWHYVKDVKCMSFDTLKVLRFSVKLRRVVS